MPNDVLPPTYAQLTDGDTLRRAWEKVASKRKAGGIDRRTVEDFADTAERDIEKLQAELIARRYVPEPYMEVKIPKKDNEMRSLGLLTVRDKVVQQALTDLLTPFIEPRFMDSSYAYRPGRGTQQAVRRVRHCIEHFQNRWLVLCDIDRFFDNIPHVLLEKQVRFFIKDEDIVQLILLCVGMGKVSKAGANWQNSDGKGIPQGGILSPLLANLYLHQLDFFIHQMHKPMGYVRFADDFVLLTREKNQADAVSKRISDFLTERLGLVLDEFEIKPVSEGFSFLGLCFDVEGVNLDDRKRHEMLEKVNELLYFMPEGGLNPAFKETVDGYQRYQGTLLKYEKLTFFDEKILDIAAKRLAEFRAEHPKMPHRQLKIWLETLPFLTPQYRSKKNQIVNDLLANKLELKIKNSELKIDTQKKESVIDNESKNVFTQPNKQNAPQKDQNTEGSLSELKTPLRETKQKEDPLKATKTPENTNQTLDTKKLIDKKRKEYEQREGASMELVISHAGVALGLTKRQITARINGQNLIKDPTANIKHISILARGVSISSNVVAHCADKNIPILFHDSDGKPYAQIFTTDNADADLWLAQSAALKNGKAVQLAREVAMGKMNNQANLLKYFAKHHSDADTNFQADIAQMLENIEKSRNKIEELDAKMDINDLRLSIMAYEGNAAQSYWHQIRLLVTDETDFQTREHQGARDLTNMLLNYGYGILYGRLWSAVLNARLHPSVSFLHTPQPKKPTLVFDMVEEFRAPVVDRTVVSLINRKEKLTIEKDGKLSMETRKRLAEKILERINTVENFRGQRIRIGDIMRLQSVNLAKFLTGEAKSYKPYLMKW